MLVLLDVGSEIIESQGNYDLDVMQAVGLADNFADRVEAYGEGVEIDTLIEDWGVPSRDDSLFNACMDTLVRHGYIEREGDTLRFKKPVIN